MNDIPDITQDTEAYRIHRADYLAALDFLHENMDAILDRFSMGFRATIEITPDCAPTVTVSNTYPTVGGKETLRL